MKLSEELPHILHHLIRALHTRKMTTKIALPEELQTRRGCLRTRLRDWKRIVWKRAHAQRHSDQVLVLRVELGVDFVPHVVVVAQHGSHDTRRREEVQRERSTYIVIELRILQRRSAEIRISQFVILFTDKPGSHLISRSSSSTKTRGYKHHNPHRIIIKCRPNSLRSRPHLHRIPHMPLTQSLPHPPLRPIHRPLLLLIHLIPLRRRPRTHICMHRLTTLKPPTPQLANNPMPPIARLRYIPIIPQPLHQLIIHARGILQRPPPRRPLAPAKPRQARHHEVEARRVGCIGGEQWFHDVLEFEKRTRPAVHEE